MTLNQSKMKNMTAVEWLESKILEDYVPFYNKRLYEAIHKAKEMEKEQMLLSRMPIPYENKAWEDLIKKHFEEWYNETFKSE